MDRSTLDSCFYDAAAYYQVPVEVLVGIAKIESSMNPGAYHINKNGSVDIGLMGINSLEFPHPSPLRDLAQPPG